MQLADRALELQQTQIQHARWRIAEKLKTIASTVLGIETGLEYEPGHHKCESSENPIGECVYNGDDDPCWDECLFCGEPFERK